MPAAAASTAASAARGACRAWARTDATVAPAGASISCSMRKRLSLVPITSPPLGVSVPASSLSSVLFPAPLSPITARRCPALTVSTAPSPNPLLSSRARRCNPGREEDGARAPTISKHMTFLPEGVASRRTRRNERTWRRGPALQEAVRNVRHVQSTLPRPAINLVCPKRCPRQPWGPAPRIAGGALTDVEYPRIDQGQHGRDRRPKARQSRL